MGEVKKAKDIKKVTVMGWGAYRIGDTLAVVGDDIVGNGSTALGAFAVVDRMAIVS